MPNPERRFAPASVAPIPLGAERIVRLARKHEIQPPELARRMFVIAMACVVVFVAAARVCLSWI